jgi:hypothetical protein
MFIWEWVLGWFGTGTTQVFDRVGVVAKTKVTKAVRKSAITKATRRTINER